MSGKSRARHQRTLFSLIMVSASLWPSPVRAYRPFDSTDAAVASRGEFEVELGPVGYLAQGSDRWIVAPNLVLNWGFADRCELVMQGRQLLRIEGDVNVPRHSVDETGVFLKAVLREGSLQEKEGPSIATELGPLLPEVHGATGVGAWAALIASQRWEYATVHLNPAVQWSPAHTTGFFGGVIIEGKDAWTVRQVAEVVVETDSRTPTLYSGLAGAIWRMSDALSLDVALRRARLGGDNVTEVRAGLTWGFRVGFPR